MTCEEAFAVVVIATGVGSFIVGSLATLIVREYAKMVRLLKRVQNGRE